MRPQTPADGIPFLLLASKPAPAGEPPLGARCAQRLSRPRRPPGRRESRGLSERRLLEPPACAFGKERAFRLKCDWLSLRTTNTHPRSVVRMQRDGDVNRDHLHTPTTNAGWSQFRVPRWGQCKWPFRTWSTRSRRSRRRRRYGNDVPRRTGSLVSWPTSVTVLTLGLVLMDSPLRAESLSEVCRTTRPVDPPPT
jgi:hypothetical protein